MYTLRIINQTLVGAEERRNILFNCEYTVLMSIPISERTVFNGLEKASSNSFDDALMNFYQKDPEPIGKKIVGFVYVNNATYPIYDYEVVYIVSDEGKTVERIYGMYQKN